MFLCRYELRVDYFSVMLSLRSFVLFVSVLVIYVLFKDEIAPFTRTKLSGHQAYTSWENSPACFYNP